MGTVPVTGIGEGREGGNRSSALAAVARRARLARAARNTRLRTLHNTVEVNSSSVLHSKRVYFLNYIQYFSPFWYFRAFCVWLRISAVIIYLGTYLIINLFLLVL